MSSIMSITVSLSNIIKDTNLTQSSMWTSAKSQSSIQNFQSESKPLMKLLNLYRMVLISLLLHIHLSCLYIPICNGIIQIMYHHEEMYMNTYTALKELPILVSKLNYKTSKSTSLSYVRSQTIRQNNLQYIISQKLK